MGPRALMNIGQVLCHWAKSPFSSPLKKDKGNHTSYLSSCCIYLFPSHQFSVYIVIEGLAFLPLIVEQVSLK